MKHMILQFLLSVVLILLEAYAQSTLISTVRVNTGPCVASSTGKSSGGNGGVENGASASQVLSGNGDGSGNGAMVPGGGAL